MQNSLAVLAALLAIALPAVAQELFKCTDSAGKVTYQQTACPTSAAEKKIDATPANPDIDLEARERLLRQGAEADQRLKERDAQDQADAKAREARENEKRAQDERVRKEQDVTEDANYLVPPYRWLPVRPPVSYPQPRPPAAPRPPVAVPRGG